VICTNESIVESCMDILRERVTCTYIHGLCSTYSLDPDFADGVRQEAVEKHEWKVGRRKDGYKYDEIAISDPYGRVLHMLLPFKRAGRLVEPTGSASSVVWGWTKMDNRTSVSSRRVAAVWIAIKKLHLLSLDVGEELSGADFLKFTEICRSLFLHRNDVPAGAGSMEILKMRFRDDKVKMLKSPFWSEVKSLYEEDPESVPVPLVMKIKKPQLAWVRVCIKDIEESYDYVSLGSWTPNHPPFSIEEMTRNNNRDAGCS